MHNPIDPYLSEDEKKQLNELLEYALEDTLRCWQRTRIDVISASLACEGNIIVSILEAFDEVANLKAAQQNASKND